MFFACVSIFSWRSNRLVLLTLSRCMPSLLFFFDGAGIVLEIGFARRF